MQKNQAIRKQGHANNTMRILYQILISIFVILSLFLMRDDLWTAYKRICTYITSKTNILSNIPTASSIFIQPEKISNAFKSIITPGALTVTKGLARNASEVKLSTSDVIDWTNKNRISNGNLPILKENKKLNFTAQQKLDDMFKQQYFEHISPDGNGVAKLSTSAGYDYVLIGENLAFGNFKDAQALLNAWMASPGHRANILNAKYADIGVAVGRGMFDGHDTWMAVQHFGLSIDACPRIDENLGHEVENLKIRVKVMGDDLVIRYANIEDSGEVYMGVNKTDQIKEYNSLVKKYNALLSDLKQKISDYNVSVRAFNSCISNNTK